MLAGACEVEVLQDSCADCGGKGDGVDADEGGGEGEGEVGLDDGQRLVDGKALGHIVEHDQGAAWQHADGGAHLRAQAVGSLEHLVSVWLVEGSHFGEVRQPVEIKLSWAGDQARETWVLSVS